MVARGANHYATLLHKCDLIVNIKITGSLMISAYVNRHRNDTWHSSTTTRQKTLVLLVCKMLIIVK